MQYIKRHILNSIQTLIQQYPVLAITGPRQSGKTTLLKHSFSDYKYVNLENPDLRSFATDDPNGFLTEYHTQVILDEVQQVPQLFSYIQTKVDESGHMGQYILSGSQNFQLLQSITQSLAGRVALFKLLPFDFTELKATSTPFDDWKYFAIKGFYPAVYDRNIDPKIYYANYLETYIERDVRLLTNVHNLELFKKFIKICAGRVGQLFNLSFIANECGISQPTAKTWLSILESSYIIFKVAPYFENFTKRVVKTSKIYFYDTGLLSHLLGIKNTDALAKHSQVGSIFENLIIAEMYKQNYHQYLLKDYWFWRDSNGHEIDLLTKNSEKFDLFEIKSTQTITSKLFAEMDYLSDLIEDKTTTKTLIYGGIENQNRTHYKVKSWSKI